MTAFPKAYSSFSINMNAAILTRADLRNANLSSAEASGVDFRKSNLSCAKLVGTNLERANLSGAILKQADFTNANLSHAQIKEADATAALFDGSNLKSTNMRQTLFYGSSFNRTKFDSSTSFKSAKLRGASWRNVNISSLKISQEKLNSTFGDVSVILPEELIYPKHWINASTPLDEDRFLTEWRAWQRDVLRMNPDGTDMDVDPDAP